MTANASTATTPIDTLPEPGLQVVDQRLARREIGVFIACLAVLSIGTTAAAAALGADMRHLEEAPPAAQVLLFGAAFLPAIAAVAARWLTGQRVRGAAWGWRRPSLAWLRRAWSAPIVYGGVAGAAVLLLGLGRFEPSELSRSLGDGFPELPGAAIVALAAVTLGTVLFAALALGEELAWRGTFVTRVAQLTTPFRAALFTGVVWSLFHWPLMLMVPGAIDGAPEAWGVACFTVSITAISFPLHRLWQRTSSVWPAVAFHASHNAVIYLVTDPLIGAEGSTAWFAGETGLTLAVGSVAAAAWLWRRWAA